MAKDWIDHYLATRGYTPPGGVVEDERPPDPPKMNKGDWIRQYRKGLELEAQADEILYRAKRQRPRPPTPWTKKKAHRVFRNYIGINGHKRTTPLVAKPR